ncbi:hypothetical protein SBIUS_v1c03160 [Spiroplasma sp. BIUS-1]|nr:hypothetical protein SBIUS_v1c03160 [Spiroplasma sp. BIUS-1]
MKKSIFLYLKQGVKGVLKFKIQFIVIVILSFLATFILSTSLSATSRLKNDYNQTMSKMDPFSYVSQTTVGTETSEDASTNIMAPMDILNNQFLYVKDSTDPSSKLNNKAIELNYNLSSFEGQPGYDETFLTKTFKDTTVQSDFLKMLEDKEFWGTIFDYQYDAKNDKVTWNPYGVVGAADDSSSVYLSGKDDNSKIKIFYTNTIEVLKENYLEDLFKTERTPDYLKNTLFYELKNKGIITIDNFKINGNNIKLTDEQDRDIYNRYLYFSLETFLRQLIKAATEYPIYWINKAISFEGTTKDRDSVVTSFNKNKEKVGFEFLTDESTQKTQFASTIFAWIFGMGPSIEEYKIKDDNEVAKKFLVENDEKPWSNNIDLSNPEGNFLSSKDEVFEKGMRGSFSQIITSKDKSGNITSLSKTFNTNYLRHYEKEGIESKVGSGTSFTDLDYYTEYTYNNIKPARAYFMKQELLAQAMGFDYKPRAEVEYTDNISEVTYRIVDVESQWKDDLTLYEGNMPRTGNEILLNAQYAKSNKYKLGDNIKVGGNNFVISGFASEPLTYYPMANTTNPLPNSKKSAIVYANKSALDKIITSDLSKTATKTMYSIITYKDKENKTNMTNDLNKLRAYSFTNMVEVYNSYNFVSKTTNELNESELIQHYSAFESSNLKLNWTIAPQMISGFKIASIIFSVLIFAITIVATIVAVKKTVQLNAGEIGILKAMGAGTGEISSSYLSYGVIVVLCVVPFAWILGSVIQEFLTKVFLQFAGGQSNLIIFSPIALIISVATFGVLLCAISFATAFKLVKRPTLEIMNKVERVKRIEWMDKTKNWITRKRSFSWKFSLELAISGFSKTIASAVTVFFAGFLVSFGLTVPGLVQNVVGSYYKNVNYSNSIENRDLIGNAPLAKTSLQATKEVDEYEKNLFDSKNIFGNGISKISKNVTDFSSTTDSSAIPQILLSQGTNGNDLTAKWVYETIQGVSSEQSLANDKDQNSLIAIIASLLGNNISQLVGKGIQIADIQKIIEWIIHSDVYGTGENQSERVKKIDEVSGLLTNGLPALLTNFINGSSTSEGDWKEQIINIIISQTPAYIKQYVTKSENRLNNFQFGWQINKYIPGVDNVYTNLNVIGKNNKNVQITGLQNTQNAFNISKEVSDKTFMNDYQAHLIERLIKGDKTLTPDEYSSISNFYHDKNLVIPVVSNDQADFNLDSNWNNLTNPRINKSRLVLRNGNINIPNQAWMYDDGDWMKYQDPSYRDAQNNGYIEMDNLSASRFTYAPIFEQTGFNLAKNDDLKLKNNAYGFYDLQSEWTKDGEKLELNVRPYYSYDNVTMFFPEKYYSMFENLINKGNVDKTQWFQKDATSFVPEATKKAWEKTNGISPTSKYFAIKPYSYYFDSSGNYARESENLSGTPVNYITKGLENFYSRTLRDIEGPIGFGSADLNWTNDNIKNITFKRVGTIGVYGNPIVIADQNIVNLLSGYGISKYVPFNMQYEEKVSGKYTLNGVEIQTYKYRDPIEYVTDTKTQKWGQDKLVFGQNDHQRSIRPSNWFTGVYSNAVEPYFITSQASFSRSTKAGQDTLNGSNYGSSSLELRSTKLLSQQKTLIFQLSSIILTLASIAISLMIIIMILTITLINDLYVNQYKKFMVVMKSIGYSNKSIVRYTFSTVTVLSGLFYILGVATNFAVILIVFNIVSKNIGSIPFGFTWWSPILAILLVFGAFFASIAITTRKIRKESPSTLMN